jgi:uncharacterized membrane protein (DUF2068 family)
MNGPRHGRRERAIVSNMSQSHNAGVPSPHRDHRRGLRAVAIIEAAKGVLVLLAAFGFFEIIRHNIDLDAVAGNLLYFFHVNPNLRISHVVMRLAERVMDADVLTVLTIATVYSSLRFVESYGLWRQRVWAEWLAIISGAIYLPFEIYKLVRRPTPAHWIILLVNIGVVAYIVWVRWDDISERGRRPAAVRLARNGD